MASQALIEPNVMQASEPPASATSAAPDCSSSKACAKAWLLEAQALATAKTGPRVLIPTPAPMPTATRARHYPGEDRAPLTDPRTEAVRLIALL